jgi:hypothetical protein
MRYNEAPQRVGVADERALLEALSRRRPEMCQSTAAALLEAAMYRGELAETIDYLKATLS